MDTSPDHVFISYAREDAKAANRLNNDLKKAGLKTWLDTEQLLAGQKWKIEIKNAITNSRHFIALLSSNSVEKRGFVQKELKVAIEILDQLPESQIFIIPLRLDDCYINDSRLNELHIIDLFPDWEQGVQKALRSLLEENKSDKVILFEKKEVDQVLIRGSASETRQEGTSQRPFATSPGSDGQIAFSKAGQIYIMNADGSNQQRLTNNPYMDIYPSWSPDRTKIVFETDRNEPNHTREIFVMNADGSDQHNISNDVATADMKPDWGRIRA